MKVICDIEADSLDPTVIWCVVCKDIDTGTVYTFLQDEAHLFRKFAKDVTLWIGHNFVGYDWWVLNKLWLVGIKLDNIRDTLVMSRLFNKVKEVWSEEKKKKVLRQTRSHHSLEAWGKFFGFPKIEFNDFSKYTPEMLTYCKQDVELNYRVWKELQKEKVGFSKFSVDLEQQTVWILTQQQKNGVKIDTHKAKVLLADLQDRANRIAEQIKEDFPPLPVFGKEYDPPLTKSGTHNKAKMGPLKDMYGLGYDGAPYSSVVWQEFNLSSGPQKVERLANWWNPVDFTAKGTPRVSEKNLETLREDAPESIKNIAVYAMLMSRISMVEQWIEGAEKHKDGRLRGTIIHLGSWSGRMSHSSPNTANIPSVLFDKDGNIIRGVDGRYGQECRELWTVEDGNVMVGSDASGIQLRVLAHYINHPAYIEAVLTDIHSYNADILGCTRPVAKTFIYSWLLGAGVAKTAQILNCSNGEAVYLRNKFVDETHGLADMLKRKTHAAQRGWFTGLDGRRVFLPNDHLSLTAYLQNGEGVCMRVANRIWQHRAKNMNIPYKQLLFVHDEWEAETPTQYGDTLGKLMSGSFKSAGEFLKMNCPLDGEYMVGKDWSEVH